jgi:hypothetical protein
MAIFPLIAVGTALLVHRFQTWSLYPIATIGVGLALVTYAACRLDRRIDKKVRIVTLLPLCFFLLWLEKTFFPGWWTSFPATLKDVVEQPHKFAALIEKSSKHGKALLGPGGAAAVKRVVKGPSLAAEPLKARTASVMSVMIATEDGKGEKELKVFIKVPGDRTQPLLSQSLMMAYLPEPREVSVTRNIMAELDAIKDGKKFEGTKFSPVFIPRPFIAESNQWSGRSLLAWEIVNHDDYVVIPDQVGLTGPQVRIMLMNIARFHAANWRADRRDRSKFAPYLNDRGPMDSLEYVDIIKNKEPHRHFAPLFDAVRSYFVTRCKDGSIPVVVGHNDFRGGNMMFKKSVLAKLPADSGDDAFFKTLPKDALAILDWEAFAFSPVWWDVNYCMAGSMQPAERRKHQKNLYKAYLDELQANGVPKEDIPTPDALRQHSNMFWLLMPAYCHALVALGGAGESWGNSKQDCDAWGVRVAAGVLEATADIDETLRLLKCERWVIEELREHWSAVQKGFETNDNKTGLPYSTKSN